MACILFFFNHYSGHSLFSIFKYATLDPLFWNHDDGWPNTLFFFNLWALFFIQDLKKRINASILRMKISEMRLEYSKDKLLWSVPRPRHWFNRGMKVLATVFYCIVINNAVHSCLIDFLITILYIVQSASASFSQHLLICFFVSECYRDLAGFIFFFFFACNI